MRSAGKWFLFIGIALIMYSQFMDISVSSGVGERRVVNLGLISDRNNYASIGGILFVAGCILFSMGSLGARQKKQEVGEQVWYRRCPFCAEEVLAEAILCKHCHSDLPPPEWPNKSESK